MKPTYRKVYRQTDSPKPQGTHDAADQLQTVEEGKSVPSERISGRMEEDAHQRIQQARERNETSLNLVGFGLRALPHSISYLTALRKLYITNNLLSDLPESLSRLTALEELDLSDNKLVSLPSWLGNLRSLQYLWLTNNLLTELPDSVGQLTMLKWLHLQDNRLTHLPATLSQLGSLGELYLHGNDQLGLPPDVLGPTWEVVRNGTVEAASPARILDYYFQRQKGKRETKSAHLDTIQNTATISKPARGRPTEGIFQRILRWLRGGALAPVRGAADVKRLVDELRSLTVVADWDSKRASSGVVELSQLYAEIRAGGDDEAKKALADFVSGTLDKMLLSFSRTEMREVSPGVREETGLRYERPQQYLVLMTFLAATRSLGDFPELEPIYRREKASVDTPRRRETVVDFGEFVKEQRRREGK